VYGFLLIDRNRNGVGCKLTHSFKNLEFPVVQVFVVKKKQGSCFTDFFCQQLTNWAKKAILSNLHGRWWRFPYHRYVAPEQGLLWENKWINMKIIMIK
jgi:hypothetical protein